MFKFLVYIIISSIFMYGCGNLEEDSSLRTNIPLSDNYITEINNISDSEELQDNDNLNAVNNAFEEPMIICDTDEFKVTYDKGNETFNIIEKNDNNEMIVECPYFWGNDGINQIESDEYKNINFEKETGILEVSIGNYTEGYVSFYLQISDGNNISCEEIEHYTYRYLNGKGIFVDEELTEEIFDEKVSSVLRRYGMDENPEEFITYSEHFPEAFIELYYNPLNDIYYVFFTEEYINTEGFVFCYSLCPLEKAPEEFLIEDPYKFEANDGTTGEEYVDDLIEDIVYDGNNIISYSSSGICNSNGASLPYFDEGDDIEILTYEYEYDDNGELKYWIKRQSHFIWGMYQCTKEYYYDIPGKCTRMYFTKTSGTEAIYYVYDNDENEPSFLIEFDYFGPFLAAYCYK